MSSDNLGSNLVYFLLGAATGAAIALLYAPQEGEETRRIIGEKASEYKDKASDLTTNVTQQAKDKFSQASDKISQVTSQVSDKAQDLLSRGQSAVNDGIDKAADKAHTGVNSIS